MSRHLTFTAYSDGSCIHLDGDEVTAVYVGEPVQPANFGYAAMAAAAEKDPPTIIEGRDWRFTVADPVDDVADAVWPA